jgi:4-amino-4-deoxy-L-arabinose transferase-like glycosyltransferase
LVIITAVAAVVRLAAAGFVYGVVVGDVTDYVAVGQMVLRGDNVYVRGYPYPPPWMFVSALGVLLSRSLNIPFDFLIKLPLIATDVLIAGLLFKALRLRSGQGVGRSRNNSRLATLVGLGYALNPISIIITSLHGQFDSLPAFFALAAVCLVLFTELGHTLTLSALLLGLGIALKGWPVLLLPIVVAKLPINWKRRIWYAFVAALPAGVTLLPFLIATPKRVFAGVFGYSGVTDHGYLGAMRSYWFVRTGSLWLPGGMARDLTDKSKFVFLIAYGLLFLLTVRRWRLQTQALGIFLAFYTFYGGLSSQYLIWVLPFALLAVDWMVIPYSIVGAGALVTFYLRFFPAILLGTHPPPSWSAQATSAAHAVFTGLWWVLCAGWLVLLMLRAWKPKVVQLIAVGHRQPVAAAQKRSNYVRLLLIGVALWASAQIISHSSRDSLAVSWIVVMAVLLVLAFADLEKWIGVLGRFAWSPWDVLYTIPLLLNGGVWLAFRRRSDSATGVLLWLASLIVLLLIVAGQEFGWRSRVHIEAGETSRNSKSSAGRVGAERRIETKRVARRATRLVSIRFATQSALAIEVVGFGLLMLLALLVRIWRLDSYPPFFHGDEGEMGMLALGILTGSDRLSPFAVRWLGHPTMFHYWQALTMAIFGRNEVGLRMLSALTGTASVGALYWLMRQQFGRVVALAGAMLMAVSHLHVQYSRLAINNIQSSFFAILVVALLGWARARRSPLIYTLAGLACGYSLYFYPGSRIIVFVSAAILLYALVKKTVTFRSMAFFWLAVWLVVAPLAAFYTHHPREFSTRVQDVFLFTDRNIRHTLAGKPMTFENLVGLLPFQLVRNLLFFVNKGDGSAFYFQDIPAFDRITVVLFWLGMITALIGARGFGEFSLLVWFWLTILVGGVLTNDAPNAPRLLMAVPAVFAFGGLFVQRVVGLAKEAMGRYAIPLALLLAVPIIALLLRNNYQIYMTYVPRAPGSGILRLCQQMRQEATEYKTYLFGLPHLSVNYGTVRFIARDAERVDVRGPQDYSNLDTSTKGALFIALPQRVEELEAVRELYPGGDYAMLYDEVGRPQYAYYRWPSKTP